MSRINCHSAFKHYEMFHNMGGDVINIGSNNTTIFNMGTGFGGGSFWSGLGYGLGNGLGSIFGGLFGGNMGGFGNFGFGMSPFGMGGFGFGMSPFGLGNIFGGGSNRVDSHSDGKGKVKNDNEDKHAECKDPDRKIINDLGSKVKDTIGNKDAKPADVKALYEKIKKAKTDSEKEPNHTETDKKDYENMLGTLKNYAKEKGWGDLDNDKFGINDNKPADKANATENNGKVNDGSDAKNNANGTEPWSNISAWNNDTSLIPSHITLPTGYSKLDPNYTIDSIDKVHDHSGKTKDVQGDTKKSTETYKAQGKNTTFPKYLAITTDDNNAYNYKIIGMSNGYPIYGTPQADTNKNVYVMCKENSTGKVVLLQFEYKPEKTEKTEKIEKMSGYGVKDAQH